MVTGARYRLVIIISAIVAVAAFVLAAATVIRWENASGWGRHRAAASPGPEEAALKAIFLSSAAARDRYTALFEYFAQGFVRHAKPGGARVQYPGVGSVNHFRLSGLEGFARTGTLLAAAVFSGQVTTILDPKNSQPVDIVPLLKKGLLAGVDPQSPEYWGAVRDFDQRIVEAADIARILWLTKAQLWDRLSGHERTLVTQWLLPAGAAKTFPTNWELFPITVELTLASLHGAGDDSNLVMDAHRRFDHYRRMYLESGWFMDEHVDFYNAWGITYELFWISKVAPGFERDFISQSITDSAYLTAHLISPNGVPIMGRSVCYRTAVPVPLIAAGRGLRALDAVWRHFIAHDSLRDGALTQGYFGPDMRYLDFYSGPGSCHWGLRSLVLAFMQPADSPFWTNAPEPLPVEVADYRLEYKKLGWNIEGDRESGEILIEIAANEPVDHQPQPYTWRARVRETWKRKPHRPRNDAMKYRARYYSSARPFPVHGTYSKF